jgi:molybdopterin-binding protein
MRLSARNIITGTVTSIELGSVNAVVKVDIGGSTLTSVVTIDAVEELDLEVGSQVRAVIKSSSVMLAAE